MQKRLMVVLILLLLVITCGADFRAENYQWEIYYNQPQDAFYIRLAGAEEQGRFYAPYSGQPNEKQRIKKLERQYTQALMQAHRKMKQQTRQKTQFSLALVAVFTLLVMLVLVKRANTLMVKS